MAQAIHGSLYLNSNKGSNNMKGKISLIVIAIFISACSTTVVPLGGEIYRITKLPNEEFSSEEALQKLLIEEATHFCKSKKNSSNLVVVSKSSATSSNQLLRAELEFSC